MRTRTIATSVLAVSALTVGAFAAAGGAAAATPSASTAAIPNSTPSWLSHAATLGRANASDTVNFRVYLTPHGGVSGLKAAAAKVSDPNSASFRKYISSAQYHASYDPTSVSVSTVRSWLAANGMSVKGVAAHNAYLQVTGTVAQAQQAFNTTINRYSHDGQVATANATALKVPAVAASSVLTINGFDTTPHVAKVDHVDAPAGFANARPCSIYYGQIQANVQGDFHTPLPKFQGQTLPYAICGYTGAQFRSAYENNSPLTGAGVTVAVVDAYNSPYLPGDAVTYAANHGDPAWTPGQYSTVLPSAFTHQTECDSEGWYGEQTLDVETVHAMATGANVRYYGAASCYDTDLLDAIQRVDDENAAQLVSNSYGEPEEGEDPSLIPAYEDVFLQGALQGISFMFSSGDSGDELKNTGLKQADYPASDPYVTAVGGTSTGININGVKTFDTGWGTHKFSLTNDQTAWAPVLSGNPPTSFTSGAGGGFSAFFERPSYQAGIVPSAGPNGRAVPDVALDADPTTGFLIGQTQQFPGGIKYSEYRLGGTSLASPMFAGMTALTLQNARGGLGFLNPLIYQNARNGTFKDVTGNGPQVGNVRVDYANGTGPSGGLVYSVRTFNGDSSLQTYPGWDPVTGVGVPNPAWLTRFAPIS